jgi:hypothetical protein
MRPPSPNERACDDDIERERALRSTRSHHHHRRTHDARRAHEKLEDIGELASALDPDERG